MRLSICTTFEERDIDNVIKIIADGAGGKFCILPKHIDICRSLEPCVLAYTLSSAETFYTAIDEGLLVKKGDTVQVAVKQAVEGKGFGSLREAVKLKLSTLDDEEKNTRAGIAKIEAEYARRIAELK